MSQTDRSTPVAEPVSLFELRRLHAELNEYRALPWRAGDEFAGEQPDYVYGLADDGKYHATFEAFVWDGDADNLAAEHNAIPLLLEIAEAALALREAQGALALRIAPATHAEYTARHMALNIRDAALARYEATLARIKP